MFGLAALIAFSVGMLACSFGAPRQSPWTTSGVHGTPEPPLPYTTTPAFPNLRFRNPAEMVPQPASDRLVLAEVNGKIFTFSNDAAVKKPDLCVDLRQEIEGALQIYGIAFHPNYPERRELYLCYIVDGNKPDGTRLSRFQITETDPLQFNIASEEILLTWQAGGHNGGCLRFGLEGYLYISSGDAAGPTPPDTRKTGQGLNDLLSCILRIDVDRTDPGMPYHIPADNPFVGREGARGEIWAYGFRNPWKMAFQPGTNELWIGDVGWDIWELIFRVKRGGNYGWSIMEGSQPINTDWPRGAEPIAKPIIEHPHSEARSVTGGFVYRGKALPHLVGAYIYGDYVTGKIWGLRHDGEKVTWKAELADTPFEIICFGEDHAGEQFVVDYGGGIHRLVPNAAADEQREFPRTLGDTGIFANVAKHEPASGVARYKINAEMWSDGASTERLFAIPGEEQLRSGGRWGFPEGSVIAKTLSIEMERGNPGSRRRVETQLLHRYLGAWYGYSYAWNEAGTDAELVEKNGRDITLEIADPEALEGKRSQRWRFVSRAECGACHTRPAGFLLACSNQQLNVGGQLESFSLSGLIGRKPRRSGKTVDPYDESAPLDDRARSYLQINCAHCHRNDGGGLVMIRPGAGGPIENMQAVDVPPMRGGFGIADAKIITPGRPWASTLYYRLATLGSGRMPHIGSHAIDAHGLDLIYRWIRQLPTDGAVELPEPSLASTEGALAVLREIDAGRIAPEGLKEMVAAAHNAPSPHVADLFRRFRSDGQKGFDSAEILALAGDPTRGEKLLFGERGAVCLTCHLLGEQGRDFGPDLTRIGKTRDRSALLESMLDPSRTIEPPYVTKVVKTKSGVAVTGFATQQSPSAIVMKDIALTEHRIERSEITGVTPLAISLMPSGLLHGWQPQEIADLLAYLKSLD